MDLHIRGGLPGCTPGRKGEMGSSRAGERKMIETDGEIPSVWNGQCREGTGSGNFCGLLQIRTFLTERKHHSQRAD